jgi:sigma-B regulation protein RsbU (phosphoserine phosphatase)
MQNQAQPPSAPGGASRLTIAALVDNANFFEGCYEASLREALDAKCRQEGHNLLLLYGGPLDAPGQIGATDNAIFRTLRPDSFDGIIVVSSMLSAFCGADPVARLVESYRPAALCSIGLALPGVPSLVLDNRAGMEAVVEHLVREHGVRRPAFLAGTPENPEAQSRLEAYKDVLARNGIAFDPALVACGYFMPRQGRSAMDSLLAAGVSFDGVVAANDNMALGAIEALRMWGRRVPRDIPVVGFDDLPLAALGNPPLTTPSWPSSPVRRFPIVLPCRPSSSAAAPAGANASNERRPLPRSSGQTRRPSLTNGSQPCNRDWRARCEPSRRTPR